MVCHCLPRGATSVRQIFWFCLGSNPGSLAQQSRLYCLYHARARTILRENVKSAVEKWRKDDKKLKKPDGKISKSAQNLSPARLSEFRAWKVFSFSFVIDIACKFQQYCVVSYNSHDWSSTDNIDRAVDLKYLRDLCQYRAEFLIRQLGRRIRCTKTRIVNVI